MSSNQSPGISDAPPARRAESWPNSPHVQRYKLCGEKLTPCTLEEYRAWQAEHPEPWLIRTQVLGGTVETIFDGEDTNDSQFHTYWDHDGVRELRSASGGQLWMIAETHATVVRELLQDWFAASSFPLEPTSSPIVDAQQLRLVSVKSDLFADTVDDPLFIEPKMFEIAPVRWESLRYRLMILLGKKPQHWYAIRAQLCCDEVRAVRTLELAWLDGLLVRFEGATKAEPPTFGLSAKGRQLFHDGKLSISEQGGSNLYEDEWVRADLYPVHLHYCPLCGGPAMVWDGRASWTELSCDRNPRLQRSGVKCPAYWYCFFKWQRLLGEIVGQEDAKGNMDVSIHLDHRYGTTTVAVGRDYGVEKPGLMPRSKLLEKLKTYTLFS